MMMLYYLVKTVLAGMYLATWAWSLKLFLLPLLDLYGGWTFLGYFVLIFLVSFATSFAFMVVPKPNKPMATFKEKDHA